MPSVDGCEQLAPRGSELLTGDRRRRWRGGGGEKKNARMRIGKGKGKGRRREGEGGGARDEGKVAGNGE